jgi:hypothetical protein
MVNVDGENVIPWLGPVAARGTVYGDSVVGVGVVVGIVLE